MFELTPIGAHVEPSRSRNVSLLTHALLTELHLTYLSRKQSAELKRAISAYVEFWRSSGAETMQIISVTRPLIESIAVDEESADATDAAIYNQIAIGMLDSCLTESSRMRSA